MEKYLVGVGKMWVSSVEGKTEGNGQITAITHIELTSDKNKAKKFNNYDGAKSTSNKMNSYAVVVRDSF